MNRPTAGKQFPAGNPIANVIVVVVTVLAIGVFVVLGVFAAVALGTIILLLAAVLGVRLWWFGRKRRSRGPVWSSVRRADSAKGTVIEGEYQEISAKQDGGATD